MSPRRLAVALASTAFLLLPSSVAAAQDVPAAAPSDDLLVAVVATAVEEGGGAPVITSLGASTDVFVAACKWAQVERYGTNIFGMKLWSYFQKIDWCYNGSTITSKTRTRWGETHFPGWSWKGHIGNSTSGGVGSTYFRAWTQGHFCLVEYFSCVQNAYPWIDMTVRGNGTWSWSAGG